MPQNETGEIDVTKMESLEQLKYCNIPTLRLIERNSKSLPKVKRAAMKQRMRLEGEPLDKPFSFYARMSILKLKAEIINDLATGKIKSNTMFYVRLQNLIKSKVQG